MTQRARAVQAKWILRSACLLWAIFMVVGVGFRLPYLRPPRWIATWELSLGALGLLWVVTAAWRGLSIEVVTHCCSARESLWPSGGKSD